MPQQALDKKNLKKFVAAMLAEGRVRGPVTDVSGAVLGDISAKSELDLGYTNFTLPPKREIFPQCEVMGTYDADGIAHEALSTEKAVIFGIRPCDAQSLELLDRVFSDERCVDPYYHTRRSNTLIIALACGTPVETCFCMAMNGGPTGKAGADIVATDLGESLLFEAVSSRGQSFMKKHKDVFRAPIPKEEQKQKQQEADAQKRLSGFRINNAPRMLAEKTDAAFWEGIAETCLGCGACTYLCPTCHCFDLLDEKQRTGSVKMRVHDACMFASFAREASGHNPRSNRGERMRQRIMHKFSYTHENFGKIYCVGCGRCILNCPSNVDIRETLAKVTA
jgi:ferredoxin